MNVFSCIKFGMTRGKSYPVWAHKIGILFFVVMLFLQGNITAQKSCAFIGAGGGSGHISDSLLIAHLKETYDVTIVDDDDIMNGVFTKDDLKAFDFGVVSESAGTFKLKSAPGNFYKVSPIPMFYTELYASQPSVAGWVSSTGKFGATSDTAGAGGKIVIVDDTDHPLAAGFAKDTEVEVVDSTADANLTMLTYCAPEVAYIPIGVNVDSTTQTVAFGIEVGTKLFNSDGLEVQDSLTTEHRVAAVGVFSSANDFITTDGYKLIDAGIEWILDVEYTLTLDKTGKGTVTALPDTNIFESGSVVRLTATADKGYKFVNWSGDYTGTGSPIEITMAGNMNITANFEEQAEKIYELAIVSADASVIPEPENGPANSIDNNLDTYTTVNKDSAWIEYDLGSLQNISYVTMIPHRGDERKTFFDIHISSDGSSWTEVFGGQSSGTTETEEEIYDFTDMEGQYVRVIAHGNSQGSVWTSIREVAVYGYGGGPFTLTTSAEGDGEVAVFPDTTVFAGGGVARLTATADKGYKFVNWSGDYTGTGSPIELNMNKNMDITANFEEQAEKIYELAITSADASVIPEPENGPGNSIDKNLDTYATVNEDGAWLEYDLGSVQSISYVAIIPHRGDERTTFFDIQVSSDGTTWTEVFSGQSSGTTETEEEIYDFTDMEGQYVRLIAHGNSQGSVWVSIREVAVYGYGGGPFVLSATALGNGKVTVSPDAAEYAGGDVVRISAVADSGFQFVNWTGGYTGTGSPVELIMNKDMDITANFEEVTEMIREIEIKSVEASVIPEPENGPENSIDKNLETYATVNKDGAWLQYDLGGEVTISYVTMIPHRGDERTTIFDIYITSDTTGGGTWTEVFSGQSSGTTETEEEIYDFADMKGRFVRLIAHGNSQGSVWTSIREVAVYGMGDVVSVNDELAANGLPTEFSLSNNYPNPFNPSTTIVYSLPVESNVELVVYDILGRKVAELFKGTKAAGTYKHTWNAKNNYGGELSSGVYFLSINSKNYVKTIKMMYLR